MTEIAGKYGKGTFKFTKKLLSYFIEGQCHKQCMNVPTATHSLPELRVPRLGYFVFSLKLKKFYPRGVQYG